MDFEDRQSASFCWSADGDVSVKAAGPKQSRIKNVWSVCCGKDDDGIRFVESIHLTKNLVQRLLTLVVASAESSTTLSSNGINFVNKNDGRRLIFSLSEQIANATRTDTNEHLNELRAIDVKVRNVGFASHRTGEQCLSGSRRSYKQDSFGDAATKFLKFGRVAEEVNDFL